MKNTEINYNNQVFLFDLIQKALPANIALVDVIADKLDISVDAAYRRMRGDKPISFEEAIKLCQSFQISMDSFVNITRKNQTQCNYTPLNLSDLSEYATYIQVLAANIERLRMTPESEIIMSASDIPLFNFFEHNELTLFKLFSWNKNTYGITGSYEEFVSKLDTNELLKYWGEIVEDYKLIPSTEIWTANTIDVFLRLLSYHYETGDFKDEKNILLLCNQLMDLINNLQDWAEKGTKGSKGAPLKLFISDTDLESTFLLLKQPEKTSCRVKLFTINSLTTFDERFCQEVENWLLSSAQRATLISGASAKARYIFLNNQKQKIRFLIEKIQLDSGK